MSRPSCRRRCRGNSSPSAPRSSNVRVEQTRHRIAEAEGEAAREAGHGEILEEALAQVDRLKERAERAGLPLTRARLRRHLIRLADARDGFAEVEGRFAVMAPVEAAPEPAPVAVGADAPPLSVERFWKLFVAEVHDLLLERGPLTAEEILAGLPDGWVAGTKRYEPIKPGRLRQKLRQHIRNKRPLEERPRKVFAATGRWPGSRTFDEDEAA